MKGQLMKKAIIEENEMLAEYDFSKGVRGIYTSKTIILEDCQIEVVSRSKTQTITVLDNNNVSIYLIEGMKKFVSPQEWDNVSSLRMLKDILKQREAIKQSLPTDSLALVYQYGCPAVVIDLELLTKLVNRAIQVTTDDQEIVKQIRSKLLYYQTHPNEAVSIEQLATRSK